MYKKWFEKVVKIEKTILLDGKSQEHAKRILDFLAKQGYRDISGTDTTFTGVRGNKLCNLINLGDPRKMYHVISVAVSDDAISVMFQIDSWCNLWTEHDRSVFLLEVDMLDNYLATECLDNAPMIEAKKRIRKSDRKILFISCGVGALIGTVLFIIVRLLRYLGTL